ncbi:TIGR03792 family protein [Oscillatoria sp. FACHB-1407]|uniref:TIGR03792 family protein n=1 Tax=Oscillatoria sp. FACHB-1407 TaxID=2692847 RepID=UPI0018EFECC7|nr:TIGR03792 family protein [Oscillatoria sp. FACHB-1407]
MAVLGVPAIAPIGKQLSIATAQPPSHTEPIAIEWLKFQVPSDQHAQFIEQDAAIWTPVLASYPGFQHKEIWTNPDQPNELVIVIHWASFEQWQAIPQSVLDNTTQRFHEAMGAEYPPESTGFRLAWSSEQG